MLLCCVEASIRTGRSSWVKHMLLGKEHVARGIVGSKWQSGGEHSHVHCIPINTPELSPVTKRFASDKPANGCVLWGRLY
jgi:hypothetical protein